MSRKGVPFLLASMTLAATVLAPQAAGATESRRSQSTGSPGAERTTSQAMVPTGRQLPPVGGQKGLADCAEGHHLSPFEMPIYDDDGLFVIGHETVWVCIPDDLEPAG